MNVSEILILVFPIIWLAGPLFFFKPGNLVWWGTRWVALGSGCLLLSFMMIKKLSDLMGGGLLWAEVFYYGWFLFSLFTVLRASKSGILFILGGVSGVHFPKKVNDAVAKIISFILLFLIAIPFFLAMTSIHRPKVGNVYNPQKTLGLVYEDVTLKTSDHLKIRGWFVPTPSPQAVIVAHGLGANKSNFIVTVDMWNQMGFNVLIFDFRGHGDSEGHSVSFGYKERHDVIAAMDYLIKEKKFLPENIWGYGVSFGGAAMLHAAAEDRRFRGLIIDSSFADLDQMAQKIVEKQPLIPTFCRGLIKEIGLFFLQADLGYSISSYSPRKAVELLAGTPVLFMHGKGDPLIPWTETELLYNLAKEPKQIYLINASGHYATLADPHYGETIWNFIRRASE